MIRFISCQPSDLYFSWQIDVQCKNFREIGYSFAYTVLVYIPSDRMQHGIPECWKNVEKKYPEVKFFYYPDDENILGTVINPIQYIPYLRPWMLHKHFKAFPEWEKGPFFYLDSDVIFTRKLDFSKFLGDDICYLSDTNSYLNLDYLDRKINDAFPEMQEELKKIDIIGQLASAVGISRKTLEENNNNSGGAQYLLKDIPASFWEDVMYGCRIIRPTLMHYNNHYFGSEDKGWQSWCTDMMSVLWNLWKYGKNTICPPELNFAWATDPIEKWAEMYIYHDAGAHTREVIPGHQLFMKRELRYVNNEVTPAIEDLSYVSSSYCSYHYARAIEKALQ